MPNRTTEDRLDRLELIEASRSLVSAYADMVDRCAAERIGDLFAPDAVLFAGSRRVDGLDGIRGYYEAHFASGGAMRHFVTNLRVSPTAADRATCESYLLFFGVTDGVSTFGWGDYDDEVRLVDGRALLTSKRITVWHRGTATDGWRESLERAAAR